MLSLNTVLKTGFDEVRGVDAMTFDSAYEPFFQPPGWIVGPIWAVLYACLAISFSSVLAVRDEVEQSTLVIALFLIQLAVNLAWPSVFNSERYLLALGMIVVMVVFASIYAFAVYKAAPTASMLVCPYIAWVAFAGSSNAAYYLEARS